MERVNINSVNSILDFCLANINANTDTFLSVAKDDRDIFLHAVGSVAKDLNQFNVKKHKCALCCGFGHNFDNCSKIL